MKWNYNEKNYNEIELLAFDEWNYLGKIDFTYLHDFI